LKGEASIEGCLFIRGISLFEHEDRYPLFRIML
jgi:hypothetical protein